ncbi:MAG: hypothetical protein RSC96_07660, partial [Oscillospiraceae bacterium]
NISVENLAVQIPETVPSGGKNILEGTQLWILLGALGGILLLLLVVMMMILGAKKKKKKKLAAADAEGLTSAMSADSMMLGANSQQELDIRKKQIQDAALRSKNENAIAEEVRDFAKANPQITANLLRNWIKEDDE